MTSPLPEPRVEIHLFHEGIEYAYGSIKQDFKDNAQWVRSIRELTRIVINDLIVRGIVSKEDCR